MAFADQKSCKSQDQKSCKSQGEQQAPASVDAKEERPADEAREGD